MSRLSFMKDLK